MRRKRRDDLWRADAGDGDADDDDAVDDHLQLTAEFLSPDHCPSWRESSLRRRQRGGGRRRRRHVDEYDDDDDDDDRLRLRRRDGTAKATAIEAASRRHRRRRRRRCNKFAFRLHRPRLRIVVVAASIEGCGLKVGIIVHCMCMSDCIIND